MGEHLGTYEPKNWLSVLGALGDTYDRIPSRIVGLILGVALGSWLTATIYELVGARTRQRLEVHHAQAEAKHREDEEARRKEELREIGVVCDKAAASMYQSSRNANLYQFAEPKIGLAVEKLRGLGIELDPKINDVGGVRFISLRKALYDISHFLKGDELELAKKAAKEHNASGLPTRAELG
jgi:hypothetical protein